MDNNFDLNLEFFEKKLLITIKTDLKNIIFTNFYNSLFKLPIPKPLKFVSSKKYMVCWMSYDEILIICDLNLKKEVFRKFETYKEKRNVLIVDVTDSRSIFALTGDNWRNVISKGCPRDISAEKFKNDSFFRSRLSNVSVALWMNAPNSICIMCPKSLTDFTYKWIEHSKNIDNISNIY